MNGTNGTTFSTKADSGRQGHASIHTPKPCRPTNNNVITKDCTDADNTVAADTQNKLHRRPTNYNHPTTHQGTRPAPICAPRGGHRYKPRPEPRRHHLTHAADTGHTSPQRRHQHKAPCIVPLPGAAAATYSHNQSHPAMYQSTIQSRVALFFIGAKIEAEPNGIKALRHSLSSEQVGSMSAPDLCPQLTERET